MLATSRSLRLIAVAAMTAAALACGDSPTDPDELPPPEVPPTPGTPAGSITPGTWSGMGTNDDGSQFEVCMNVAQNPARVTVTGSTCDMGGAFVLKATRRHFPGANHVTGRGLRDVRR